MLHAVRTQTPPASLILSSANFENNLALTITGILGRVPLPRTLKYPDLVTSMTGTLSLVYEAAVRVASETSDQSLSILIVGQ